MAAALPLSPPRSGNLAGKSAEAAKEIEGLINESVNRVDVGNEFMEHSVKTLQQIVENAKKTSAVIMEVANPSGNKPWPRKRSKLPLIS